MEPTSVELNTSTNTKESKEKEKEAIPSAAKPDEQSAAVIKRLLELHPNGPPEDPAVDHYYVLVELEIEKISKIDTSCETVTVEFLEQFWYMQKSLIGKFKSNWDHDSIRSLSELHFPVEDEKKGDKMMWVNEFFSPHGIVCTWRRYTLTLNLPMDLTGFPFDTQKFELHLMSEDWAVNKLHFIPINNEASIKKMKKSLVSSDWELETDFTLTEKDFFTPSDQRNYSRVTLAATFRRKPNYYLYKVILVVIILGILLLGIPVMDPSDFGDRFNLSLTLFLTTVAFQFVVGSDLPKIAYLTSLDNYFLSSYLWLLLSVVENVTAFLVDREYPFTNYAKYLDWAFIGFLALCQAVLTIRFLWPYWTSKKRVN